jgi:hypothetical protein
MYGRTKTTSSYGKGVEVRRFYLVEDIISQPSTGDTEQNVQTLVALVEEDFPASVVVALLGQAHDLRTTPRVNVSFQTIINSTRKLTFMRSMREFVPRTLYFFSGCSTLYLFAHVVLPQLGSPTIIKT